MELEVYNWWYWLNWVLLSIAVVSCTCTWNLYLSRCMIGRRLSLIDLSCNYSNLFVGSTWWTGSWLDKLEILDVFKCTYMLHFVLWCQSSFILTDYTLLALLLGHGHCVLWQILFQNSHLVLYLPYLLYQMLFLTHCTSLIIVVSRRPVNFMLQNHRGDTGYILWLLQKLALGSIHSVVSKVTWVFLILILPHL